jgi:hypothetical protein
MSSWETSGDDGQRHQLRGLPAGKAEHQPLVAGAADVDPLGDVGRLRVDRRHHGAGVAVEAELVARVADLLDDAPRHPGEIDVGLGGDLAGEQHEAGGDQGLAGDAAGRILPQDLVEDRVGDLVRHFVRVTLGHRLGREQMRFSFTHRHTSHGPPPWRTVDPSGFIGELPGSGADWKEDVPASTGRSC